MASGSYDQQMRKVAGRACVFFCPQIWSHGGHATREVRFVFFMLLLSVGVTLVSMLACHPRADSVLISSGSLLVKPMISVRRHPLIPFWRRVCVLQVARFAPADANVPVSNMLARSMDVLSVGRSLGRGAPPPHSSSLCPSGRGSTM